MPTQLSLMEREKISQMRFSKASGIEIAAALGRSPSTISRELRRNSSGCEYSAVQAQDRTRLRKATRPFPTKMSCVDVNGKVRDGIISFWSPEQIAGRMVFDKLDKQKRVSRSTIERWIKRDSERKHWESFLRRRGKRKPKDDRRGHLPSTVSIAGRPVVAEQRGRCGDWEGDTIVSPGKRSGLVSTTDRLSGMLKLNKVKNLKSATVIDKMLEQFRSLPPQSRHTLTLDNGKEFAQHERLSKLIPEGVFFARPAHPWERGTNENTNGLIRQFVPKRTDIAELSPQRIKEFENLLNERPRKRHGFKTPNEVFTGTVTKPCCV